MKQESYCCLSYSGLHKLTQEASEFPILPIIAGRIEPEPALNLCLTQKSKKASDLAEDQNLNGPERLSLAEWSNCPGKHLQRKSSSGEIKAIKFIAARLNIDQVWWNMVKRFETLKLIDGWMGCPSVRCWSMEHGGCPSHVMIDAAMHMCIAGASSASTPPNSV